MKLRSISGAVLLLLAVTTARPSAPAPLPAPPSKPAAVAKPAVVNAGWPTYHNDNTRAGYDGSNTFNSYIGHWSVNSLIGDVYASPVVWNGLVYIATEQSYVYALDEHTGAVQWSHQVATPTPDNGTYIGCGSFGAYQGITGTPAVDTATGNLFVVTMVATPAAGFNSQYELIGLNALTGATLPNYPVSLADPNLEPAAQGQRGALAIANGRVYIPFGGRYGDCPTYHPWVMGVSLTDQSRVSYQPQTAGQDRAGIWAPSGESIDAAGNVYVETGNGGYTSGLPCDNTRWDHGNAAIKLSAGLVEQGFFAPADWCNLSQTDTDLGSVAPLVLPNNELFVSGKSGDGWLMNTGSMPGFGAPQQSTALTNCNHGNNADAVFGGFAYANGVLYVPCDGHGLNALNVNPTAGTFADAWQSTNTYNPGAPIVAGGYIWDEPQGGGTVYGYRPGSGAVVFTIPLTNGAHRFTTLAADGDRLFAMLSNGVESLQFSTPTSFTVAYTAYFPWFDRISNPNFLTDNIHVVNPDPANAALVTVTIPGQPSCVISGDSIPPRGEKYYPCATGFGGPVRLDASARVIASQRVRYGSTFNETPALDSPSTSLLFPWYDLASDPGFVADNIHVINPNSTAVTATVTIPGCGSLPKSVPGGGYAVFNCQGGFGGPVTVTSSGGGVLASQRVLYYGSFNEEPAQPASAAGTSLWGFWYDLLSDPNFTTDNIHVVNPSGTTANVTVNIPGCGPKPATIPAGQQAYVTCAGGFGGPVHIISNVRVLASARVRYAQTFNEVAALPAPAGAATLFSPWYDHFSDPGFLTDNVHVVNPNGGSVTVTVTIPGCSAIAPQTIPAAQEAYFNCASGFGGPVVISSSGGSVIASQRVRYNQSFNEVAAQA